MSKKNSILILSLFFVVFTSGANASAYKDRLNKKEGKKYLSLNLEYTSSFDSDVENNVGAFGSFPFSIRADSGYGIGGAFGYYVDERVRIEAEVRLRKNDIETLTAFGTASEIEYDMDFWNWAANAYYTHPVTKNMGIYIGGGLGISHHADYEWGNPMIYQGMTGIDYDIDFASSVSAGYRYFATGEYEVTVEDSVLGSISQSYDIQQHIFEVSYRFKF